MKIRRFKGLIAKGWYFAVYLVTYSLLSLMCSNASAKETTVNAVVTQETVKAGDMIRGTVIGNDGPMMMANVTERDAADRIVAHSITDIDGNFSFRLVDPSDRIRISYYGYETVDTVIAGSFYNIKLKEGGDIPKEVLSYSFDSLQVAFDNYNLYLEQRQGVRARAYGPQYPKNGYPLLVVDGKIMQVSQVNTQCLDSLVSGKLRLDNEIAARIVGLKEHEIKSVSLLKDAAATTIWGQRGANGVIEVETREGWYKRMERIMDVDFNKYAWESINDKILETRSKTELNSLPGEGLYIPSDHATFYSIEDFYNNWILK